MEFMVEISCLRKSATSSFCKALKGQARWPWFRKSLDLGPGIIIFMFSKMQKSAVFFGFKALRGWVGFGFCGLILSFAALRECDSFFLFFLDNKFQESLYN